MDLELCTYVLTKSFDTKPLEFEQQKIVYHEVSK